MQELIEPLPILPKLRPKALGIEEIFLPYLVDVGCNDTLQTLKNLSALRLVCTAWNNALHSHDLLKAFFSRMSMKELAPEQLVAVKEYLANSLAQSTAPSGSPEIWFLKRFYFYLQQRAKKSSLPHFLYDHLIRQWFKGLIAGHDLPLHQTAKRGAYESVKCLLMLGADKEGRDSAGQTPLHMASFFGHLRVVNLLLTCHAQREAVSVHGHTPLHFAVSRGHLPVIRQLLDSGANKEAADEYGSTPLHIAAMHRQIEAARLLIAYRANSKSKTGAHPIFPAMTPIEVVWKKYVCKNCFRTHHILATMTYNEIREKKSACRCFPENESYEALLRILCKQEQYSELP